MTMKIFQVSNKILFYSKVYFNISFTVILAFLKRGRFPLFVSKLYCVPAWMFLTLLTVHRPFSLTFAWTFLIVSDRLQIKTVLKFSETEKKFTKRVSNGEWQGKFMLCSVSSAVCQRHRSQSGPCCFITFLVRTFKNHALLGYLRPDSYQKMS